MSDLANAYLGVIIFILVFAACALYVYVDERCSDFYGNRLTRAERAKRAAKASADRAKAMTRLADLEQARKPVTSWVPLGDAPEFECDHSMARLMGLDECPCGSAATYRWDESQYTR